MPDLRGLAIKVASSDILYRKFKDGESPPHLVKAKHLRYKEALAEFHEKLAQTHASSREKDQILRWAYDAMAAKEEIFATFRNSPPIKLFKLLMGCGKFWNFGKMDKIKISLPHESKFSGLSFNELVRFFYTSPEINEALEALVVLSGGGAELVVRSFGRNKNYY